MEITSAIPKGKMKNAAETLKDQHFCGACRMLAPADSLVITSRARIELTTYSLGGCRSILLSYRDIPLLLYVYKKNFQVLFGEFLKKSVMIRSGFYSSPPDIFFEKISSKATSASAARRARTAWTAKVSWILSMKLSAK